MVVEPGGPEVLTVTEIAEPTPGAGELLVELAAAGVNFIDVYRRQGVYPTPTPFVPGSEGAGTVRQVGAGVAGFAVGDRVAWKEAPASYAELVVVAADEAVPVPDQVPDEVAAALLLQGMTAHYLTTSTYPVRPGDWAVVHAGAGGVGLLLTQLVRKRGGHVLATVSTPEKAELARGAGADDVVVGYAGFGGRVRELTGGDGAAVVYDGVGRDTFDEGLAAVRRRGMFVLYGAASGQVPPLELQRLNREGSLFITRPTLAHYGADPAELRQRADDLLGWVADGSLDVRIGGRYRLAEARQAHADLQARRTTGKLLLHP
jgi:NADPH2:quinone reductase